jgi:3-(3-hydroxy-phenyl)propionate hydroxylase
MGRVRALTESAPMVAVQVIGERGAASAVEHVRDPQDHLRSACHVFGHMWALVRPDAYVAATGESVDASLVEAVARCLGAAETAIVRPLRD